ncbi:porin family protein [Sedimentitalea arenosa]|uniref:Porin family protein n=1 Tax=Sedimentitalea arenosa TaxID=2798803 RepID=A0A8J7LWA0_9RHOB|nr:porin family protein [Arenibacterium arenosum]MBJ6371871.1 porin family protein [Arenibacterium arenosum]
MHHFLKKLAVPAIAALPSTALAEDWSFAASVYLFTPETETTVGDVGSTLSFKEALENLDAAFMGTFEARRGRWSLVGDYMLTDLSFGNSVSNPNFDTVNTTAKTEFFSGYATYRVYQESTASVDLAAGFRWFKTDTELVALSGGTDVARAGASDSWVDPVIGLRAEFALTDRWSGLFFADYGGFSSDSETWQVLVTANYALSEKWMLRAGYRQISVDHDINGRGFTFEQSGPIFGAVFSF